MCISCTGLIQALKIRENTDGCWNSPRELIVEHGAE